MKKSLIIPLVFLLFSCNIEPKRYLNSALDIMEENSIRREKINWEGLRQSTLNKIKGKKTIEETYPIIEDALKELGDHHSFFEKKQLKAEREESNSKLRFLQSEIIANQIAYLKIPAFNGSGDLSKKFAKYIQGKIKELDKPEIKGWIIDLSENYGGNMWPMYLGLAPLLGEGISGYFFDLENNNAAWSFYGNAVYNRKAIQLEIKNSYVLKKKPSKIAILIGEMTASSGEAIAITFIGLPFAKSFGQHTAGVSTGNVVYELSDGARLILTTSIMADRTKKLYGGQIAPDIPANNPKEKAMEWIMEK